MLDCNYRVLDKILVNLRIFDEKEVVLDFFIRIIIELVRIFVRLKFSLSTLIHSWSKI